MGKEINYHYQNFNIFLTFKYRENYCF
jgi:hypothetical protein